MVDAFDLIGRVRVAFFRRLLQPFRHASPHAERLEFPDSAHVDHPSHDLVLRNRTIEIVASGDAYRIPCECMEWVGRIQMVGIAPDLTPHVFADCLTSFPAIATDCHDSLLTEWGMPDACPMNGMNGME